MSNKNKPLFTEQDYAAFDQKINAKKVIRYADVKDRLVKVAFDVVRFKDTNDALDKLWVIKDLDGEKVLVAMYEDDADESLKVEAAAKNPWSAVSDMNGDVNVFYKSEPVVKFASESFGIPKDESYMICKNLPKSLATDKSTVHSMLKMLGEMERTAFYKSHPELI